MMCAVNLTQKRHLVQREVEDEKQRVVNENAARQLQDQLSARRRERWQRTLRL